MEIDQKKTLVASIAKFLENEIKDNSEREDSVDFVEGLEVAVQCIRSSFDLTSIDYERVPPLPEVYEAGCKSLACCPIAVKRTITDADKAEAERLKAEGNTYISESKFLEAVNAYSRAIEKDPYNAVYYGNRAAAYSKLNDHSAAIADCERALQNDPAYSKAYGRMGFAYAALKNHAKAVECYEKALSLEPDNPSYRQNLETARTALPGASGAGGPGMGVGGFPGFGGGGPGGGGMDLMSLLNNPQMMQMASQMMQSPQVQQMVASMMGGMAGGPPGGRGPAAPGPEAGGPVEGGPEDAANPSTVAGGPPLQPSLEDLLRMGQQFASQMQAANPDLVESLRQEFQQQGGVGGGPGGAGGPGEGNPPGSGEPGANS